MKNIFEEVLKINMEKDTLLRKQKVIRICNEFIDFLLQNKEEENYLLYKKIACRLLEYCEMFKNIKNPFLGKTIIEEVKNILEKENGKFICDERKIHKKVEINCGKNGTLEDVIGLEKVKTMFFDSIKLPILHPELFIGNRKPPRCILLYGPPGTGKTCIVNLLGSILSNLKIIQFSASDIFSKYVGDSEKQIRNIFETAENNMPCVIFIDEIDFICQERINNTNECNNRIKSELLIRLNELDTKKNIFFVGATNFPWSLDHAFIRRFHKKIYIGLPEVEDRIKILKFYLSKNSNKLAEQDYTFMAENTNCFSGSDIKNLCENMLCLTLDELKKCKKFIRENNIYRPWKHGDSDPLICSFEEIPGTILEPPLLLTHFQEAIKNSKSSIKKDEIIKFIEWTNIYGEK
ncbi:vacuolar protein sorting-associated protein [Hamiltosporidium magnivora]|uniref:Vacuolar protein sorting-associated protein n=1 Tax=Hamiltosporidium magnivora TaxID=148818 RepID=A0A4Q9LKD1_9MICR|nr:vacuolar protein sorting-associated protein [Hamiltosporidium magnivora]